MWNKLKNFRVEKLNFLQNGKKEHPNELFRNLVQRLVTRNQTEVYISAFDISKSAVNSDQAFISTLANKCEGYSLLN